MSTVHTAPLKPDWAFVLQLHEGTSFSPEALCGRIEHVTSGRSSFFTSVEDARAFMQQVMGSTPASNPDTEIVSS